MYLKRSVLLTWVLALRYQLEDQAVSYNRKFQKQMMIMNKSLNYRRSLKQTHRPLLIQVNFNIKYPQCKKKLLTKRTILWLWCNNAQLETLKRLSLHCWLIIKFWRLKLVLNWMNHINKFPIPNSKLFKIIVLIKL